MRGWRLTTTGVMLLVVLVAAGAAAIFGSNGLQKVVIPIAAAVLAGIVAHIAFGRRRRGG